MAKETGIPLVIAAKIDPVDRAFYQNEVAPLIDGRLIRYVGEVDFPTKVKYLKKARCLIFPVQWEEPFGLVIIEALACGTPVVAFKRGSLPEFVTDGVNGYLVPTVEAMARAVGQASKISARACRRSVEGRFAAVRFVDEHEALFLKLHQQNV